MPWVNLTAAVNPRTASVIINQGVQQNKKLSDAISTDLKFKNPFSNDFKSFYQKSKFGVDGDPSCRRIVIDGSNVARCHGQVPEIKVSWLL